METGRGIRIINHEKKFYRALGDAILDEKKLANWKISANGETARKLMFLPILKNSYIRETF